MTLADLKRKVDAAIGAGRVAIAVTAFIAVVREGLETALFIYTNFKTVGAASSATIGLVLGLALAVALGYLIYNRSVRINLSKFFQITGTALIIVAAGVLSYGIHEYQELGWLPGADAFIWDVTSWMVKDSILATVLAGSVGFDTTTSWLQFIVAGAYIAGILWLYLKPARAPKKDLISA